MTVVPVSKDASPKSPSDDEILDLFKIIAAAKLQTELESPETKGGSSAKPPPPKAAAEPAPGTKLSDDAFAARMAQLADAVEQTIEVEAPPADCVRVAADFERYPQWAGSVQYAKVLEQTPAGDLGRRAEFRVGAFGTTLGYTLEYDYDPPRRMRWTAVAGGVKELLGVYEFTPTPDGRTQVPAYLARPRRALLAARSRWPLAASAAAGLPPASRMIDPGRRAPAATAYGGRASG